ncbi:MAG: twin-arginine translocase subunit TatC [Candidatus Electrothrix sp. AUS4]|nr:twin-arginine translocase subunit TatC [Candidatus Electrothrix sp. AUS4]
MLPGGLFFYLKLALVAAVLLACPVIFHQIWRFIAPGLYQHEKKLLLPFSLISTFCFLGGAAFGYFVVFPPAFRFLISYSSEFLDPMPAVSEYFSLALRLLLAFGVIFELPVFMVFLAKIGTVNAAFLTKNRKYAFLIAFIIAAIVTPTPDVVNQLLMAGPLLVLYEISIVAVRFFAPHPLPTEIKEENTEFSED